MVTILFLLLHLFAGVIRKYFNWIGVPIAYQQRYNLILARVQPEKISKKFCKNSHLFMQMHILTSSQYQDYRHMRLESSGYKMLSANGIYLHDKGMP